MDDLVPAQQKTVLFYDDEITVAVLSDEDGIQHAYIPVRPICETLGVAWSSQLQRIRRDPVLKDELLSVFVTNTESQRGGREVQCLPLDYISGFLFGLKAGRVRPDLRDKVIRYQKECYKVLAEAMHDGRLTMTSDEDIDELLRTGDPEVVSAYQMARAMMRLARQQLVLDARVQSTEQQIVLHTARLDEIEAILTDDGRIITDAQAAELSQAVKTVALAMDKPNFGAIYGQMYRHYQVTSYKKMRADQFRDAMNWLTEYYIRLTGAQDVPF